MDAGLPNITGNFTFNGGNAKSAVGAFSFSNTGDSGWGDTWGQNKPTISFDASKSNSLYGNSNTVQPAALQLILQIKF